jgi:imidazolonepropionase-like amidohydrolase
MRRVALRDGQRMLGRFVAGGGRLALSGGSPQTPYGLGLHAELRLLAGAGLGRAQVLQIATAGNAAALGLRDELGRVAPGQQADLLIVAGDPLADLDDLLRIETIIVGGRVHPLEALLPAPAAEKFTAAPAATRRK